MKFLKKFFKLFCYRQPVPEEDFSDDPLPQGKKKTSALFPQNKKKQKNKDNKPTLRQTTLDQYFKKRVSGPGEIASTHSYQKLLFKSQMKSQERKKPQDEPSKIQEKSSISEQHHTPRSHHSFHKERRESFYNLSSSNVSSSDIISNSSLVLHQPEQFITRRSLYPSPQKQEENSPSPVRNETETCEVAASPLEELKLRTRIIPELRTKSSSFSSSRSPIRSLFFTHEKPISKYPNNFTFCENNKEERDLQKCKVTCFQSPGNESIKTGLLTSVSSIPEGAYHKYNENPLSPSLREEEL